MVLGVLYGCKFLPMDASRNAFIHSLFSCHFKNKMIVRFSAESMNLQLPDNAEVPTIVYCFLELIIITGILERIAI